MYKEQCDDALLSLQISKLAGEYEIVTIELLDFLESGFVGGN